VHTRFASDAKLHANLNFQKANDLAAFLNNDGASETAIYTPGARQEHARSTPGARYAARFFDEASSIGAARWPTSRFQPMAKQQPGICQRALCRATAFLQGGEWFIAQMKQPL